ncbi:MAG: bifunctional phosphopantothenoylcysteine decarboxylase/phosphopantothenate--cysteine ligase CoaBC [Rickettsiales bacterium]
MSQKSVLLIITGSIAAYKSLDLIRRLRAKNIMVRVVLTESAKKFVTEFSVAALTEGEVYSDLWSLKDESEMGHIRLSREADIILVAPASADIIAKISGGFASDLASSVLLASNKPLIVAPAMNSMMFENSATKRNIERIKADGALIIETESGVLACGEVGQGRMADIEKIERVVLDALHEDSSKNKILAGVKILVTAGATFEAIDPVRYLGNHSSGKQGYAIAEALAEMGADVTLISGKTSLDTPKNVKFTQVTDALNMLERVTNSLLVDVAIFAAAVSDWRVREFSSDKIKKNDDNDELVLNLVKNPDILKTVAGHKNRPKLVIGFAAETEDLEDNAITKRQKKNCDWILANNVANGKVFERDETAILFLGDGDTKEYWNDITKRQAAVMLAQKIAEKLMIGKD